MSGGHFDYQHHRMHDIIMELDHIIETNKQENEWGKARNYPEEILDIFKKAKVDLHKIYDIIHEIDYLLSGDHGEDSFLKKIEVLKEKKYE